MNPEEAEFHRQLNETPEDESAALVYADWLEEHGGKPGLAEIIRTGIHQGQETRTRNFSTQRTGTYIQAHNFPPSTRLTYATPHALAGKDSLRVHLPSLTNPNRTFSWAAWIPRSKTKRLIPQLHSEGFPLEQPNENNEHDVQQHHTYNSDRSTEAEPHQMSRNKPLVVSYRRDSLRKKYTVSTVARVMGHGQYANETAGPVAGSRLATVLREIKHGVGKQNPALQKLTQHALGGTHEPKVYTAIRDELFRTKDPRAVALARQYNWHKVGEGLERDKHLKDFVINSAKGTKHEGHHQMFRRFYNGVAHGKNGPHDNVRDAFYRAMQQHLKNQTGKVHSYEDIENSLHRLGETEENHEKMKGKSGGSKFESPDYTTPAYTGTPKEGKFPPIAQVTPREQRKPGQFSRPRFKL